LGALFLAVRDGKIDLIGVPIAPICAAYLRHLAASAAPDVERAATTLLVLAIVLERKASHLLPRDDNRLEPDPDLDEPEPWVHEFLPVIGALQSLAEQREQLFFRCLDTAALPYELPIHIEGVSSLDLARALQRLLERAQPTEPPVPDRPRRSLADHMGIVLGALRSEPTPIEDLVSGEFTRTDAVFWFLALLELIRLGQAQVVLGSEGALFFRARTK
jgi:segregation and condensation protein A